jgi:TPR repeat protein
VFDKKEEMHCIAACYAQGLGVKQDWREAVKWYKRAADKV